MPKVVFKERFYDGTRRYAPHEEHDVPEDVVLPTRDILSIDGVKMDPRKPAAAQMAKPKTKAANKPANKPADQPAEE